MLKLIVYLRATPLHAATESKRKELVEFLLLQGANPNALDINNATPLHLAASSDSIEVSLIFFSSHIVANLYYFIYSYR